MWHQIVDFLKGLFGGKGTVQVGSRNNSVTTGDNNSGPIVFGNLVIEKPALPKDEPERPLSIKAKTLLVKTFKDKDYNLVIWTALVDYKIRMQAAGNRIYADNASGAEKTDWHEAFEEIKSLYQERTEG